jgi:predicted nucleic acid-binding protein
MKRYVVDASVAIKWYVPEIWAESADHLLQAAADGNARLLAPDLIIAEMGNILWKKHRLGELQRKEVLQIIRQIRGHFPVQLCAAIPLLEHAWEIARVHERSVYDALYLALAEERQAIFVTADERLVNALSHAPLAERIRRLGDWVKDRAEE